MSDTYTVWWIDDRSEREDSAETLEGGSNRLIIEFLMADDTAKRLGLEEESSTADIPVDQPMDPDLVLLDWKLNEVGSFNGTGKSLHGLLRDNLPRVPIYGFSSETQLIDESIFDDTFDVDDLVSAAEQIVSDIDDYYRIGQNKESIQKLVSCLEPPDTDAEQIEKIVPREFTGGLSDDGSGGEPTKLDFAEWVRNDFLSRPGLLLDRVWTATKLGVKQEILCEQKKVLLNADVGNQTYNGVFEPSEDRWWKSKLIDTLVDLDIGQGGDGQFTNTWEKGAELLNVSPAEQSTCSVCGEAFPETVAAGDSGEKFATEPVHFRCSDVYKSRMGAYADFRVMQRSELNE